MKLTELEPRWFGGGADNKEIHGLSFQCPHCKTIRLGVPFHHSAPQRMSDDQSIHHTLGEFIWQITGDAPIFDGLKHGGFESVSLTPSVDASKIGHWHGFITNGEIR